MAELTYTLGEHPQIKELLSVLEQNNLQKQKEEVQALVGYMDSLEGKLAQMMEEMKEMRLEIRQAPRQRGIRARCAQLVTATEGKSSRPGRWFSPPRQILFPCRAHGADLSGKRALRPASSGAGFADSRRSLPDGAASLTLAGRWNSVPGSWM